MVEPLHFHQLKQMADSPAHYLHKLRNKPQPTRAMRLGTAVDTLVYKQGYVVDGMPENEQVEVAAFLALGGKPVPKRGTSHFTDGALALGMYRALRNHADAWSLLTVGSTQKTIRWELAGRQCEGTPDTFTPTRLVSLKTTKSSHPDRFARDARFRGYHAGESWYALGLQLAGLAKIEETLVVAVENVPPHCVTVFETTEAAELQGEKLWRSWFERLMVCEASGNFPGYTESRVPFDVPEDGSLSLIIDGEEAELE